MNLFPTGIERTCVSATFKEMIKIYRSVLLPRGPTTNYPANVRSGGRAIRRTITNNKYTSGVQSVKRHATRRNASRELLFIGCGRGTSRGNGAETRNLVNERLILRAQFNCVCTYLYKKKKKFSHLQKSRRNCVPCVLFCVGDKKTRTPRRNERRICETIVVCRERWKIWFLPSRSHGTWNIDRGEDNGSAIVLMEELLMLENFVTFVRNTWTLSCK